MREIKFRAWDKRHKKMRGVMLVKFYAAGQPSLVNAIENEENWEPLYIGEGERDEAELMQYTGLKDKNGEEIYEGDIISAGKDYLGNPSYFPIEWVVDEEDASAGWAFPRDYGCFYQKHTWQVVGNIYENPELLEGEGK